MRQLMLVSIFFLSGYTSSASVVIRGCNYDDIPPDTCIQGPAFEQYMERYLLDSDPYGVKDLIDFSGSACACTKDLCTDIQSNYGGGNHGDANNLQPLASLIAVALIYGYLLQ